MNELNDKLEREIDRALKSLPEMRAPSSLAPRVMAVIEGRARVRWYQQSWVLWPMRVRATVLAGLAIFFAGLCVAMWHFHGFGTISGQANTWMARSHTLSNVLLVILGAMADAVKRMGTGFIAACVAAAMLGYAMCLGLGTLCVRLTAPRK
jgi:hypothetical protein